MKTKKSRTISFKLIVPIAILIIIMIFTIMYINRTYFIKVQENEIEQAIELKVKEVSSNINRLGEKALYSATIYSELDFVKEAYSKYYETGNIEESSLIIETKFETINKALNKEFGGIAKINFYLPPTKSFIRCWNQKRGDELTNRKSLLQISKNHKPIYGIETAEDGFVIRALSPIFSDQGKFYGSVEVIVEINSLIELSKSRNQEEFAIFITNAELEKISPELKKSLSINDDLKNDFENFTLINKTSENFVLQNVSSEMLTKGFQNVSTFEIDKYSYATFPIYSLSNEIEGVAVYQLDISNYQQNLTMLKIISISGALIFIFVSILITLYFIRKIIIKPINEIIDVAKNISEGNLTQKININSNDEIGTLAENFQNLSKKLNSIIGNIFESSTKISSASDELKANSYTVSQGANEQAASTEEVSSSMEQMSSNIQQNTENSQQTEKISLQASNEIQQGSTNMNLTVEAMKSIASKISIITDISFQTNILALNAAVEAARAGEQGKGFAVVAAEVRKLAERSQFAANEINEITYNSVTIAEETEKQLKNIVPNIQNTSKLVQEITATSIEMNIGSNQVNNAIQQLNQVTQQNVSAAEEMATTAEELANQAQQLTETMSFFKIVNSN